MLIQFQRYTPPPLSEVDITFFIPFTLASIDSSLLVTSASITRDELPGILNEIVSPGKTRDGASLTGNNGTKSQTYQRQNRQK